MKLVSPSPGFWTLSEGAKVLGQIGATLTQAEPGAGYIGSFDVDVTHSDAQGLTTLLLKQAEDWLKAQGCKRAIGPMTRNTWFPYRFRTDDDARSFAWEPSQPRQYPQLWREAGYVFYEGYHSQATREIAAQDARLHPAQEAAQAAGYRLRDFETANFLERDMPALYRLSMSGFAGTHLFEPISEEVFRSLYVPLTSKVDLSLSHFLVDEAGQERGFMFSFLDRDPLSGDLCLVMKSLALDPSLRGSGLSNALVGGAVRKGIARGCKISISALIREGNRSAVFAGRQTHEFEHRYALFSKAL